MDEPSAEASEASLLERVRAGDVDAFAELARTHHASVRMFLGSHVRDAVAVEDLVQDVFLRAFQGLDRLREPRAFRSWLLGIAHHRALEHLRDRLRLAVLDEGAFEVLLDRGQLALLEGEDEEGRRTAELEALRECLRQLPGPAERLVRDYYFRERPMAYLAARGGKNEGAVRVALFRLREALRDCVRARMASWSGR